MGALSLSDQSGSFFHNFGKGARFKKVRMSSCEEYVFALLLPISFEFRGGDGLTVGLDDFGGLFLSSFQKDV